MTGLRMRRKVGDFSAFSASVGNWSRGSREMAQAVSRERGRSSEEQQRQQSGKSAKMREAWQLES